MSWAAKRTATREEDVAYSLMGIFDVNMPMLYGEGAKAFIRLQGQILQTTNDHSLFAWGVIMPGIDPMQNSVSGFANYGDRNYPMLADSPNSFDGCGNIEHDSLDAWNPVELTNIGLKMTVPVVKSTKSGSHDHIYWALLGCRMKDNLSQVLAIPLVAVNDRQYQRFAYELFLVARSPYFGRFEQTIYSLPLPRKEEPYRMVNGDWAFFIRSVSSSLAIKYVSTNGEWDQVSILRCFSRYPDTPHPDRGFVDTLTPSQAWFTTMIIERCSEKLKRSYKLYLGFERQTGILVQFGAWAEVHQIEDGSKEKIGKCIGSKASARIKDEIAVELSAHRPVSANGKTLLVCPVDILDLMEPSTL